MPRPRTGRTGTNVTLYLSNETYKAARKFCTKNKVSVSDTVDRLLVAEFSRKNGIAHLFPRIMKGVIK